MITLYQFPPGLGLSVSVSPYCAKLELYFLLTGREYRTQLGDVRKSPNKKLPYVRWPDGSEQADSRDIIDKLEKQGPRLDDGLSDHDRALGLEIEDLANSTLYFACLYTRFVTPAGWRHQKDVLRPMLPWVVRPIVMPIIRNSQKKLCNANGFADDGGYDATVVATQRIEETIGDKPFLLCDDIRTADCGVWANVLQSAYTPVDNPGRKAVRDSDILTAYIRRVAERAELDLPALS